MLSRAVLLSLCVWLSAGVAAGSEPSAADRETARALMRRGDTAYEREDFPAALEAFQGAHAIMQVPTTGMEVARTLAALNRFVEARKVALELARMPVQTGEPAPFARARAEAAELARSLESRVAKLEVVVQGAPAGTRATVRVDGQPLDAGVAHEIDPGGHRVEATAGAASARVKVVLGEGETRRETLVLVAPLPKTERRPAPEESGSKRALGFMIGGIGVAGVATAAVTGVMLMSRDAEIDENCPEKRCNAEGRELIDGSQPLLVANAVAWGVGIVGLGVGTWLVLSSDTPSEPVTAVGPRLVPGGAGLGFARSF